MEQKLPSTLRPVGCPTR